MAEMSQRERLMMLLTNKTRQLGRKVTFDDMTNDPEMPAPNNYAFYAGSFDAAAEEAWSRVRQEKKASGVRPVVATSKLAVTLRTEKPDWSKKLAKEKRLKQAAALSEEQLKFTEEEWLRWLFEDGKGKLPNRVELKREKVRVYYRILEVFGNWLLVERKFEEWLCSGGGAGKSVSPTGEQEALVAEMTAKGETGQEKRVNSTGWGGRRKKYSADDARNEVYRLYKLLDGCVPSSVDVLAHGKMSWPVLTKNLGPRSGWLVMMKKMDAEREAKGEIK